MLTDRQQLAGQIERYRDKAEECRATALRSMPGDLRESFLQIAVTYDALADDLEQVAAIRERRTA